MKPMRLPLLLSGLLAAAAAHADPALQLSQGEIFSDPVGSVIEVTLQNGGTGTVVAAVVTCAFAAGGRALGSASTTLYNVLPGEKDTDQVHMMGAKADVASCQISSVSPSQN